MRSREGRCFCALILRMASSTHLACVIDRLPWGDHAGWPPPSPWWWCCSLMAVGAHGTPSAPLGGATWRPNSDDALLCSAVHPNPPNRTPSPRVATETVRKGGLAA
uniref:Secreted protein n=1 Tax=Ixodes ricinus TaxID=34613 RepID=A0A6B0U933_IXORI